jgi:hypothetical protein
VSLAGDSPATQPSCFLSTSKILTPTGYKPVSQLKKDDLVTSLFGDVPVKRVLKSRVSNPPKENSPFLVPKDFFGPDVPSEDLWLSGWHRIFFKNNKIQTYIGVAANSVSGLIPLSIEEAMGITGEDDLFYYHLELTDRNNCLIASNLLVESFNQISSAKELDNFIHSE